MPGYAGATSAVIEFYRDAVYTKHFLPKVKIEIVAGDNMVLLMMEAVQRPSESASPATAQSMCRIWSG